MSDFILSEQSPERRAILGSHRPGVYVHANMAALCGHSLDRAGLLEHLIYLSREHGDEDDEGWFFATVESVQRWVPLSAKKQRTAIRHLESKGLIETDLRGLPAKRHFRVNVDRIITLLIEQEKSEKTPIPADPARCAGSDDLDVPDGTNKMCRNGTSRCAGTDDLFIETKAVNKRTEQKEKALVVTFDDLWSIYPRKVKKQAARKAWDKRELDTDQDLAALIVADVQERSQRDAQWMDGKRFIPHASTYLNQGRWTDEITPPREYDRAAATDPASNDDRYGGIE